MKKTRLLGGEFVLVEFILDKNETRQFVAEADLSRSAMDMVSLYTHGRFEITDAAGAHVAFREPGDFSGVRPDIPAGRYTMTALEDGSRILCLNPAQRGHLFQSAGVRLQPGDGRFQARKGSAIVVGRGGIEWVGRDGVAQSRAAVALVLAVSGDLSLRATETDTMLMEIWR